MGHLQIRELLSTLYYEAGMEWVTNSLSNVRTWVKPCKVKVSDGIAGVPSNVSNSLRAAIRVDNRPTGTEEPMHESA